MMVMVSNQSGYRIGYWQAKYGGMGHLYSPGGARGPFEGMPFALDNGAYESYKNGTDWSAARFVEHLDRYRGCDPLWVVAPDVVEDADTTLEMFPAWRRRIEERGWIAALALQDGVEMSDAEQLHPDVVFVGGSIEWKWRVAQEVCTRFRRVHIARCNSPDRLYWCRALGVESVDGTRWFGGNPAQTEGLRQFLSGERPQQEFQFTPPPAAGRPGEGNT